MPATSIFLPERCVGQLEREPGDDERGDADRDVDPEAPAPVGVVGEQAAEQRADDGRDAEQRTHRAHVLAALLGGHDVGDDRLRQDHQTAAAEALHAAPEHELAERLGEPGTGRGEREQADRDEERPAAAPQVAELAVERHDDRDRQDVGGDDPALVLDAVELADDRRHRGADDRLVERGQEHARHERTEDEPDGARGQDDERLVGRVVRCGGCGWPCGGTSFWAVGGAGRVRRRVSRSRSGAQVGDDGAAGASSRGAACPPAASQRRKVACVRNMSSAAPTISDEYGRVGSPEARGSTSADELALVLLHPGQVPGEQPRLAPGELDGARHPLAADRRVASRNARRAPRGRRSRCPVGPPAANASAAPASSGHGAMAEHGVVLGLEVVEERAGGDAGLARRSPRP